MIGQWKGPTNDEESGFKLLLIQVCQKIGSVQRWAIVVGESPCQLVRAFSDVSSIIGATTTGPPTVASVGGIGSGCGVVRTATSIVNRNFWNGNARVHDFVEPLVDFRRVFRSRLI